jgi:hypothetical protein
MAGQKTWRAALFRAVRQHRTASRSPRICRHPACRGATARWTPNRGSARQNAPPQNSQPQREGVLRQRPFIAPAWHVGALPRRQRAPKTPDPHKAVGAEDSARALLRLHGPDRGMTGACLTKNLAPLMPNAPAAPRHRPTGPRWPRGTGGMCRRSRRGSAFPRRAPSCRASESRGIASYPLQIRTLSMPSRQDRLSAYLHSMAC